MYKNIFAKKNAYLLIALLTAIFLRLWPVILSDFPLNDGGMFYAMTRELRDNAFILPEVSNYNLRPIPFAYPPFTFYFAAIFTTLMPIELLSYFHFMPVIFSIATVFAFFRLATALQLDERRAIASLFCFALMPRSFVWQVMGGGLTRSAGLFFATSSILLLFSALRKPDHRLLLFAAITAACAITSHLATAAFLFISALAVLAVAGFGWQKMRFLLAFLAGTLFLSSPWWLNVISTHGVQPFLNARQTVYSIFDLELNFSHILSHLGFEIQRTYFQAYLPIFGFFAALGCFQSIIAGKLPFILWWILVPIIDTRQGFQYATVPLALIMGYGLYDGFILPLSSYILNRAYRISLMKVVLLPSILCAIFAISSIYAMYSGIDTRQGEFGSISKQELESIDWLSKEIPSKSKILVIENYAWWHGRYSEWIPALTTHHVVNTVQGTEWLENKLFLQLDKASQSLINCRYADVTCLKLWGSENQLDFEYVYIPSAAVYDSKTLIRSLRKDPGFKAIYDAPGKGKIFKALPTLD